jgi:hypothetical protein
MKLVELASPVEVVELERQLDDMFKTLGLDVEFSRHFIERLLGRERRVTVQDITSAFQRMKQKYKQRLLSAKKKGGYEAILKDFSNDLNIVFGIKGNDLINVTIKQKDPSQFVANIKGGEELRV